MAGKVYKPRCADCREQLCDDGTCRFKATGQCVVGLKRPHARRAEVERADAARVEASETEATSFGLHARAGRR